MGSTPSVLRGYNLIFQNSSCCWEGFLLPRSATRLCESPSPTQLSSSICSAPLGKLRKSDGSGSPTPRCSWMRCSRRIPYLNTDDPVEEPPRGRGLQRLRPSTPSHRPSVPRGRPRSGSPPEVTAVPQGSLPRIADRPRAPLPPPAGKGGRRAIGKRISLLIANQHLSLLACKQGNLALLLH